MGEAVVTVTSTFTEPSTGVEGTHTYQYDALGRRVRKTTGGTSPSDTIFAHTGEQILADYSAGTAATTPTTKYARGSYIDELICRVAGIQILYPHRNQQYSTTALTDQTGAVVERYAYTSYGDLVTLHPTTLAVLTTAPLSRYTYTGREHDAETCGYHFRTRPYSATLGRFGGHDPIRYPDGANTYVGWFAMYRTDPYGLHAYDEAAIEAIYKGKTPDGNGCVRVNMSEYLQANGIDLSKPPIEVVNGGWRGCVGITSVLQKCTIPPGPSPGPGPGPFNLWPEQGSGTKCFKEPKDAQSYQCPSETPRPFYFTIEGVRSKDIKNLVDPGKEVRPGYIKTEDDPDGYYNYISMIGDYCVTSNHMRRVIGGVEDQEDLQTIKICKSQDSTPCHTSIKEWIRVYCVTCKCKAP